jgi:branched-chain amino acid transport system substrate-binding protein
MKNGKKFIALLIMVFLLGTMVGCGGAKKEGTNTNTKAPIKIGLNMELSGAVAEYGTKGANGAMLAFEEINKGGGVLGQQIEAIKMDNKSDNAEAASVAANLAQQGVVGYVGSMTTGKTLAAAELVKQNKIPMISPTATATEVTVDPQTNKVRDYVFRVCFLDPFQGQVMAKFAGENLKAKSAAILMDTSNDYSKGLAKAFKEYFVKQGGTIVAEEGYVEKDKEFKATLTKIKAKKPDVIFVPGYYNEVGLIVKQGRDLGIEETFPRRRRMGLPQLAQIAGAAALNNTYFCNHFSASSTDPKVQAFVKAFKAKYGVEPDGFAALGYDAAGLMADAIKRAGSADPAKITAAIAATKDYQGVAGTITMDANHNPVKTAVIIEMKDGKEVVKAQIKP